MPKLPGEGFASAISEITKLLGGWMSGSKGRRTRKALLSAQRGLKRAIKLYPKLKEDKIFVKHKKSFDTNSIRK